MTILKLLRVADAFTIANAALGFLAITYISDAKYLNAEILLLLAVVADGLDGIVARRFGGGKESMGDYLDIMADYLSFCVAPAILFYQIYFDVAASPFQTLPQDILVGLASALLVIFGLLRLARHVAKAGPEAGRFSGLPTTGAGLLAVLLIAEGGLGDVVTALLIAAAACLMVTEIPYPKVRGPAAVASGGAVVASAAVLALIPSGAPLREIVLLVALAGAAAYATSGVAFGLLWIPVGPEVKAAKPKGARAVKAVRDEVERSAQRLREVEGAAVTREGPLAEDDAREAAERLREVERREKDLDRREAALVKRDRPRPPQEAAKGKRRREGDSQEVDPDA